MEWFKDQFGKSNIMSGLLAVIVWSAIVYLAVIQVAIPDILYAGGMTIIAFFFGSRVGQQEGVRRAVHIVESVLERDKHV